MTDVVTEETFKTVHDRTSMTCCVCGDDTSEWTDKQRSTHGIKDVNVAFSRGTGIANRASFCMMCYIGLRDHHVEPFIIKYHEPVQAKLNKIIAAVQEAME